MAGRWSGFPFVLATVLAAAALGCPERTETPAQAPAGAQRSTRAAKMPEGPKKAAIDSQGRLVVEIRADDTIALHVDGAVLGTYSDGPSLRAALEGIARTRPELAKHATVHLPLVFGYKAPREFWEAMDAAGYAGAFGAPLIRRDVKRGAK